MSGGTSFNVRWRSEAIGANRDVVYIPPPSAEDLAELGGWAGLWGGWLGRSS